MKKLTLIFGLFCLVIACESDLDQTPSNIASADSLTEFSGVLNAAYFYQLGAVTPMAVMGDFRADNGLMTEEPFPAFDRFDGDLVDMEDQFFGPFYTALYKSILSANNVIANSLNATQVGEAKFLRALSYFKLVQVFGDVPLNTSAAPSTSDTSILARVSKETIYTDVIIPDLQAAKAALGIEIQDGRASRYAAQALLGKVYLHRAEYQNAASELGAVVNGAASAGISLQANFADIFGEANDLNSEIIFAIQVSSSITDEYGFSEFWSWSAGLDTKALEPLDPDLVAAFNASDANGGGTDLRRAVTINAGETASPKFPQEGGPDHDWIEIRLADVILMYAEALNQTGSSAQSVLDLLDPIRSRAGLSPLDHTTISSQSAVARAIQNERRLELAFEGKRWFDLVRTGTVDAEMGQSVNSNYHIFPIPVSEILASGGVITQNPGY